MGKDVSRAEIVEFLKASVVSYSPSNAKYTVKENTNLIRTGIVDSLAIMQIATAITTYYAIELKSQSINPKTFKSISDICDLVTEELSGQT